MAGSAELRSFVLAEVVAPCWQAHLTDVLGRTHLETLLHGNLAAKDAVAVVDAACKAIGAGCALPADQRAPDRVVRLQPGALLYRCGR